MHPMGKSVLRVGESTIYETRDGIVASLLRFALNYQVLRLLYCDFISTDSYFFFIKIKKRPFGITKVLNRDDIFFF